jgi:uncharacterized protein YqhQ
MNKPQTPSELSPAASSSQGTLPEFHGAETPPQKPFHLGGQALIEGVMMRSPRFISASVRRADGRIETRVERFHSVLERSPLLRLPLVRGVVSLVEMMVVGTRFLRWSGDIAMEDEQSRVAASSQNDAPIN